VYCKPEDMGGSTQFVTVLFIANWQLNKPYLAWHF